MDALPYTQPELDADGFNCPRCHAYAHQLWLHSAFYSDRKGYELGPSDLKLSLCSHCQQITIWVGASIIYPAATTAPSAHADLPVEVRRDYEEAASIVDRSPRGAAALLRLAIDRLTRDLGAEGHDLNARIADLVKRGLPPTVQKVLDSVRVIGNEALHPGELDLRDDAETVATLFMAINLIAQWMIAAPKQVEALYGMLPEDKRANIDRRDGK